MNEQSAGERPRLYVGVCTYKRPDGLAKLLESLAGQTVRASTPFGVIVVDNDGQNPKPREICSDFVNRTGIPVEYQIEPTPGISAARNKVFAIARAAGASFVAMLDDDEWADENWLSALLAEQRKTGASVVGGPVTPVFPDSAADLNTYKDLWAVNKIHLKGAVFVYCTCNFLIEMAALEKIAWPPFEEQFGLSGGGDTVFFRRLFFANTSMAWSDDAKLCESIPESRANWGWIRKRYYRKGNHSVHWERVGSTKLWSLTKTILASVRLAVYPLTIIRASYRKVRWLLEYERVRGRWSAHKGSMYVEYARPAQSLQSSCRG